MTRASLPVLTFSLLLHATLAAAQPVDGPTVLTYIRLGASAVRAEDVRRVPAAGFGLRAGLDTFAIDVSGLNFAFSYDPNDPTHEVAAGSLLRVQGIRYLAPSREGSPYVGAGLGWGFVSVGRARRPGGSDTSWHGRGLQGELTVGYEVPRSSALRFLVQVDASMPLFRARSETYAYPSPGIPVSTGRERRYIPFVVVAFGVGWQRR